MARNYHKRYHEYRGRRRGGSVVLKIIIALLALVLLACLVFVAFLGGRVEYTDEGVRFVLPWTEEPVETDEPVGSEPPTPPLIVIEDPEEPTEEPSPEPEPELGQIGAVEVTVAQLLDGTAAQLVTDAGGNALVVEMKAPSGVVQWDSAAALPGFTAENGAAAAEAVRALAQSGELHLVARVTCFRDQALVANQLGGPLMTQGGNMWYDSRGMRWVSPASEAVRSYLTQLCLELASMGFDEILLDCAGYPYFGETWVLATDALRPEGRSGPVEQFWQELKTALAEEKVWMSVLVTGEMALGTEEYSGIDPDLLTRYADRVWVEAGVDCSRQAFADRVVVISGTAADGSWASVNPIMK